MLQLRSSLHKRFSKIRLKFGKMYQDIFVAKYLGTIRSEDGQPKISAARSEMFTSKRFGVGEIICNYYETPI